MTAPEENSTILIVDDNPINCKVLMSSLEVFHEYRLLVAHNGLKAIQIAEKANPDLILLDINMPELNGFQVCERLKQNPETRDIPIIFLSALDDVDSKITGFAVGGVDYITKPFYKEEVIARVQTQVRLRQLQRNMADKNKALESSNIELQQLLAQVRRYQLELEESHDNIKESINYAQRIQFALLPTKALISNYLPDFFSLYKPRDVVSGDFFWFARAAGKSIVAAVDCTGHGVPGALMSVIGNTQLNSIVYESKLLDSELILTELDSRVRKTLKQRSDTVENQDGMDVALVVIDHVAGTIDFAGANLPLYVVRGDQIYDLPGDKYPIGGTQFEDKVFHGNVMKVEPNDVIYLASDGFPDQFGGEHGRKLSRRRFKEVLVEANRYPVLQQGEYLMDVLTEWQGTNNQLDDVMVLGFRVSSPEA
jgi:phosphoserine phosphatase RsbU/P